MKELPTRIQGQRKAGFKLPPNTVCITRGTDFGNPFKVGGWFKLGTPNSARVGWAWIQAYAANAPGYTQIRDNAMAVDWYRELRRRFPLRADQMARLRAADHLACFCKLGEPCHGDVLIELLKQEQEF